MKIYPLHESAEKAADTFRTFKEGRPDLIPTGITAIDESVGGLGPGTSMIIGASGGLGKSSVMLDACLTNQANGIKTVYISCEDGPDVFGCRLLARYSGVDSRKIRKKSFDAKEELLLSAGYEKMLRDARLPHAMMVVYAIGRSLGEIAGVYQKASDLGCKAGYFDYIQKPRGPGDDRRNEVSRVFTTLHGASYEAGMANILASQISRQMDKKRIPTRAALKESGDLENEARMVLMLGRLDGNLDHVEGRLDKSTFGGEGLHLRWERGTCGTLFQVEEFSDQGEF